MSNEDKDSSFEMSIDRHTVVQMLRDIPPPVMAIMVLAMAETMVNIRDEKVQPLPKGLTSTRIIKGFEKIADQIAWEIAAGAITNMIDKIEGEKKAKGVEPGSDAEAEASESQRAEAGEGLADALAAMARAAASAKEGKPPLH